MSLQLTREGFDLAEELLDVTIESDPQISMQYPESWNCTLLEADRRGVRLEQCIGAEIAGEIEVETRKPLDLREIAIACKASQGRLEAQGFRIASGSILPLDPPEGFISAMCYSPRTSQQGISCSYGKIFLQHVDASVILSVMGPDRTTNLANWSVVRRATELVRDSVRVV
jgi:hypothetical protein